MARVLLVTSVAGFDTLRAAISRHERQSSVN
jgi:hypothetical protein